MSMGDSSAMNKASAATTSGKGKGKERVDSVIASFWLPLLKSAAKEIGLDNETYNDLADHVQKNLDEQFAADFDDNVLELLQYDEDTLDDRIASESRGLKRDIRRTQKKQGLLDEEQDRLERFRPSRKANEQEEAREIAERLHPLARQYLSKKANAKRSMSSRALQDLGRAKRELESLEEGLLPYEPENDEFLVNLLERLKSRSKPKKLKK